MNKGIFLENKLNNGRNSSLSVITSNGLNSPIKRQTGRIDLKIYNLTIYYLQESILDQKIQIG